MKKFFSNIIFGAVFAGVLGSGLVTSAGAAVSDADVLRLYSSAQKSGVQTSIESRERIDGTDFEQIVILFKKGNYERREAIFSDGRVLFTDIIEPKTALSYQLRFENEQKTQAVLKSYAALTKILPQLQVIELVRDPKNPFVYLFTDPLCKYCREAMATHDNDLNRVNLRVIFAPIEKHGDEALRKSIKIIQECKRARTLEEKLAIFTRYFSPAEPDPTDVSAKAVRELKAQSEQVYRTGAIRGVPSIIMADMLR